jgi:hypothetical protein
VPKITNILPMNENANKLLILFAKATLVCNRETPPS